MIKAYLLIISILVFTSTFSQKSLNKELDSITTIERAERFISERQNKQNKILIFNEEKHKTQFSDELFKMAKGGSKVIENEYEDIHYKVIEKTKKTYYRVHYILLDGTQLSIKDIEELRPHIKAQIKNGVAFKDLAMRYSMDSNQNKGGDSGWITNGDMLPEFEAQVMNDLHSKDDVFYVNVESNKWYYVVKKTFDKKRITEIKVLKVVEPK